MLVLLETIVKAMLAAALICHLKLQMLSEGFRTSSLG